MRELIEKKLAESKIRSVSVADLPPSLGRAIKRFNVREAVVSEESSVDGGSGELYMFNLADGRMQHIDTQDPARDPSPFSKAVYKEPKAREHKIPKDHVIIEYRHSMFRGKRVQGLRIYVRPGDMDRVASSDAVSEREYNILRWAQDKYRKKDNFYFNDVTQDELKDLVAKGYMKMNRAGATSVTPKGKNAEMR